MMFRLRVGCLAGLLFLGLGGEAVWGQSPSGGVYSGLRTWTTVEGRSFQASLLGGDGAQVILRLPNGESGSVAIQRLSAADQAFVRGALGEKRGAAGGGPVLGKREWPTKVEVDSSAIDVKFVSEASGEKQYVYHSKSFEFEAQDKLAGTVMREVARTFEATRALMEALPWGIQPSPPAKPGYYRAKLYENRENYIRDGGPVYSGGVYFRKDRMFRIPFQSLGLELRGKTWFKNERFQNDTLVHEVTHQMMHDFLPFLPTWMIEGTAEYAAMLPYHAGRFSTDAHERGIKEYIRAYQERTKGSVADMISPLELMNMTSEGWHQRSDKGGREQSRLYFSSCLLVYFFCHLDGDGKGGGFLSYFDQIREAKWAWAEFFKKPEVRWNPDGSYTYPSNLTPPSQAYEEAYGRELGAILVKGRDSAALKQA
ncbi:MAG: hypothetical protein RLZZ399_2998, partial [Verrucomicrobiota bacterium]